MLLFLILQIICPVISSSNEHPDRVTHLPGAPTSPSFPLYSGYLTVEIENTQHSIFYVLCEAIHVDPLTAPLVVWLNGGPGYSSLLGFLLEHGPYILDANTGELRYNEFSWNQYANVLYIESPSGVGFSRANRTLGAWDDHSTAVLNMNALEVFMTEVHSRYVNREFFLTGESYGGFYIPFLATAILYSPAFGTFTNNRLKGIAMGNPGMDVNMIPTAGALQMTAMGMAAPRHVRKMIQHWEKLLRGDRGDYDDSFMSPAHQIYENVYKLIGNATFYNLRSVCEEETSDEIWHIAKPQKSIECQMDSITERFMNREDVQKAMHAISEEDAKLKWKVQNDSIFEDYNQIAYDTVPMYRDILEKTNDNFRILFYSGDLDLACASIHIAHATTLIARQNKFEELVDSPKIWQYRGDFAGALTSYRMQNSSVTMDVLTVRGAGHMVPTNKPARAFQIINNFLSSTETPIDYSKKIRRK